MTVAKDCRFCLRIQCKEDLCLDDFGRILPTRQQLQKLAFDEYSILDAIVAPDFECLVSPAYLVIRDKRSFLE